MNYNNIHLIKCHYKEKYFNKIIKEYDEKYLKLINILNNIPYNNKKDKIKKHFPIDIYNTFDEYLKKYNKSNNGNVSFSMLSGDFELQIKIILDTIDRRYNTIKNFGNNLK